ncbi:MAG: hypothetical protein AT718_11215 [Vulcanisaeta sp. JCHS_4]|nr:MAG: hypothetical protein AT718_11215 [Vulcanisaeta sp. JCHS_4]
MYPRDVRSFYSVGLDARVPIGVFSVDVEEQVDNRLIIGVKPIKWGYTTLSALRDFLAGENSKGIKTQAHMAFPAGLGHSLYFILRRLGFRTWWFKMVNADPTIVPLKAGNDYEVLRNIAYLHAIHRLVVIDKLKKPLRIKHKTATPTMHAILMISGYNHDKHLIQQHVPRKIMEKLPKITLT